MGVPNLVITFVVSYAGLKILHVTYNVFVRISKKTTLTKSCLLDERLYIIVKYLLSNGIFPVLKIISLRTCTYFAIELSY